SLLLPEGNRSSGCLSPTQIKYLEHREQEQRPSLLARLSGLARNRGPSFAWLQPCVPIELGDCGARKRRALSEWNFPPGFRCLRQRNRPRYFELFGLLSRL